MRYQLVKQLQGYSRQSVLMAGGCFLMGALGWATPVLASVPTITDGTYIAVTGPNFSYSSYATATTSPNGVDYTNGALSQSLATTLGLRWASASATASLTNNELSLNLQSTNGLSAANAEMWDTLIFGGSVNANTVNANTVLGTLNMAVTISTTRVNLAMYGLGFYDPSTFSHVAQSANGDPNSLGNNCGLWNTGGCGGGLGGSFGNIAVSRNSIISLPITLGDLHNGQVAYIAEIHGNLTSGRSSLVIDPSVTITGLYPGVTVSSLSGTNYVSAVPVPPSIVLFGSGALLMCLLAFRKKPIRALQFSM